jgi:hypothetical protein
MDCAFCPEMRSGPHDPRDRGEAATGRSRARQPADALPPPRPRPRRTRDRLQPLKQARKTGSRRQGGAQSAFDRSSFKVELALPLSTLALCKFKLGRVELSSRNMSHHHSCVHKYRVPASLAYHCDAWQASSRAAGREGLLGELDHCVTARFPAPVLAHRAATLAPMLAKMLADNLSFFLGERHPIPRGHTSSGMGAGSTLFRNRRPRCPTTRPCTGTISTPPTASWSSPNARPAIASS